jgi:hypothetical protein
MWGKNNVMLMTFFEVILSHKNYNAEKHGRGEGPHGEKYWRNR